MELRQLRYFVAVAEELHFSRAAQRLHLAQSALSAQVRALEKEVGGALLLRTTRRVELTPAGESLLAEARRIVTAADEALTRARALARGEAGGLVLGCLGPAPGGLLAPLVARFGGRHPEVRVEVRAFDFDDTVRGLRDGSADLAFVYAPLDEPDLIVEELLEEPRVVVLPRRHRLAGRRRLSPADLAGEIFVVQPDSTPQAWRDFWMLTDELGYRPPASPYVGHNIEEWLHLVGRGEGIDTCPAVLSRYYPWPEVAYVPLVDAPPCVLVLARHRDNSNPLLPEFSALAHEVAQAVRRDTPGG